MAETLPYMNSTGLIPKILDKIKEAKTPDRFSQDFLGSVLGFTGGSARPFIPLAKRLGFINSDGTPSPLYSKFRGSEDESKAAMAAAIKNAYSPLYKRNEYVHHLDKKKLDGLVKEVTGVEDGARQLVAVTGTFEQLRKYADFDSDVDLSKLSGDAGEDSDETRHEDEQDRGNTDDLHRELAKLRFGYTININLPNTNDIAVFNAIFKSLKEHLL